MRKRHERPRASGISEGESVQAHAHTKRRKHKKSNVKCCADSHTTVDNMHSKCEHTVDDGEREKKDKERGLQRRAQSEGDTP